MKRWQIRYEPNNIYVSREFPEIRTTLTRVIARVEGWEKEVEWAKRDILREAKSLGWRKVEKMTLDKVNKKIKKLFEREERWCPDGDCLHCERWFYPCGYFLLYRALRYWGFEEVWNSNMKSSTISFAPTHIFEKDGVRVTVAYGWWDVEEKKEGAS
jgi:hypothetical protein